MTYFTCNICGKSFDSPQKLGGHKSFHARENRRLKKGVNYSFSCLNCDTTKKVYIKPSYLKKEKPKFCSLGCKQEWYQINVYKTHKSSLAKVKGDTLDITNEELEEYRKKQVVCEICGEKEKVRTGNKGVPNRLSVDHNHSTKKFRGLLCYSCNIKIGWIENNWESAKKYLEKNGFRF